MTTEFAKTSVTGRWDWLEGIKSQITKANFLKYFGVGEIKADSFSNTTSLIEISLPDTLTKINSWQFDGDTNLDHIDIPKGVLTIGRVAFRNLSSCRYIILRPTRMITLEDMLENGPFYGTSCPIYVPSSVLSTYQSDSNWSTYSS